MNDFDFAKGMAEQLAIITAESVPDTDNARAFLRALMMLAIEHIGGGGDVEIDTSDWLRRLELVRKMVREYADEKASELFVELTCSGDAP